jgi:hypothetical protein
MAGPITERHEWSSYSPNWLVEVNSFLNHYHCVRYLPRNRNHVTLLKFWRQLVLLQERALMLFIHYTVSSRMIPQTHGTSATGGSPVLPSHHNHPLEKECLYSISRLFHNAWFSFIQDFDHLPPPTQRLICGSDPFKLIVFVWTVVLLVQSNDSVLRLTRDLWICIWYPWNRVYMTAPTLVHM